MKKFFKRLFCKHSYQTQRWHWFHGFSTMEPRRIEAEMKCCKCGKTIYVYPERGSNGEEFFMSLKDKQEI